MDGPMSYTSSGFYIVGEERLEMTVDPAYWYEGPSTWRSPFLLEQVTVPVLRDANGRDGEWPEVIRLEHAKAYAAWHGDLLAWWPAAHGALEGDVLVPVFAEDLERLAWRRRKWWGRGPVKPLGGGCVEGDDWCARRVVCRFPGCLPF